MKKMIMIAILCGICSVMTIYLSGCGDDAEPTSTPAATTEQTSPVSEEVTEPVSTEAAITRQTETADPSVQEALDNSTESEITTARTESDKTTAEEKTTAKTAEQTPATHEQKTTEAPKPTEQPKQTETVDQPTEPSPERSSEPVIEPSSSSEAETPTNEPDTQPSSESKSCNGNHQWGEWIVVRDEDCTNFKGSDIQFDNGHRFITKVCSVTYHAHAEQRICAVCGEEDYRFSNVVTDLWTHDVYPGAEQSVKDWFEKYYIGMVID